MFPIVYFSNFCITAHHQTRLEWLVDQEGVICHGTEDKSSSGLGTRPSSFVHSLSSICALPAPRYQPQWPAGTGRPICSVTQGLIDKDGSAEGGLPGSSKYLIFNSLCLLDTDCQEERAVLVRSTVVNVEIKHMDQL